MATKGKRTRANLSSKQQNSNDLAQDLGRILFIERISNSVYNDEYYQNCESADYNRAYALLKRVKEITPEDLDKTFTHTHRGYEGSEQQIEYTALDLIKMTLRGDFNDQYKETSSQEKNFQTALSVWEATKKIPGLWEEKNPLPKSDPRTSNHDFWLKNRLSEQSLAEIVGERINDIAHDLDEKILLSACAIGEKLKKSKEFQNTTRGWEKNAVSEKLEHPNMEEYEKIIYLGEIQRAAKIARKKEISQIQSIEDWQLRGATIRYIVKGESGDKVFDEAANQKELLSKLVARTPLVLE